LKKYNIWPLTKNFFSEFTSQGGTNILILRSEFFSPQKPEFSHSDQIFLRFNFNAYIPQFSSEERRKNISGVYPSTSVLNIQRIK